MNILVFNCGSSSIKYQLINMIDEDAIAKGVLERVGLEESLLKHEAHGKKNKIPCKIPTHKEGIALILSKLTEGEEKVIDHIEEIDAVGHRVVHGGEEFSDSVLIDEDVMKSIKNCIPLAPLHNPANIMGIEACEELLPSKPQVAVFDTAFHQTMPKEVFLYALPYEFYEKYKIRKYGFHGTSHRYVTQRTAEILGKNPEDLKLITCHLGNGASVTAVKNGKSLDTSMGFTPLEGLVMGTRSGDLDPAVIFYIQKRENLSAEEVDTILNKKSGVKGISGGISSDMRDIEEEAFKKKNPMAQLALDKYHYQIVKYIGAYAASLNGVDAIIFTGGVGENGPESREEIIKSLTYLGITLDTDKNLVRGKEETISTPDSKVKVLVVPTNEELMIARDTKKIADK